MTAMPIASAPSTTAARPAPAPRQDTPPAPPATDPGAAVSSLDLRWEQRGMFQPNWVSTLGVKATAGSTAVPVAMVDTNWIWDRQKSTNAADRMSQAATREFGAIVAERGVALLQTLTSNLTSKQYAANKVEPGEFAIALKVDGSTPLYYTGLIKTAPQPVLDLIAAAQALRGHLK